MTQHEFTRIPVAQSHLDWLTQMGFFGKQSGGDPRQMKADFSALELLQYPSGLAIIEENELTECIHILFEGSADVSRGGSKLATITSGAVFGELGILIRRGSSAAVTAGEGCQAFRLGKILLLNLQRKYPGLVPLLLGFAKKHLVHA